MREAGLARAAGVVRVVVPRVAQVAVVILGVTVLTFLMLNLLPGDVVTSLLGEEAPPEARAALRAELGLDQPLLDRYLSWLGHAVTGDLGSSLTTGRPVVELIGQRIPATAEIAVLALAIALAGAVPAALLAAHYRGRWPDRVIGLVAYGGIAAPPFLAGTVLLYLVSVKWGLLPATGWRPISEGPAANLQTAIMPALSLATVEFALFMRVLRSDLVGQLSGEEYPSAARARGLTMRQVMVRHVLRNSSLPLVTIVGLQVGVLLGGAVIVENLFAVPGLGDLLVSSIYGRDVVTVQGVVVFLAVVFVVINTVVDFIYKVLDPRIRYGSARA